MQVLLDNTHGNATTITIAKKNNLLFTKTDGARYTRHTHATHCDVQLIILLHIKRGGVRYTRHTRDSL